MLKLRAPTGYYMGIVLQVVKNSDHTVTIQSLFLDGLWNRSFAVQ